jgi:hypothetical protein
VTSTDSHRERERESPKKVRTESKRPRRTQGEIERERGSGILNFSDSFRGFQPSRDQALFYPIHIHDSFVSVDERSHGGFHLRVCLLKIEEDVSVNRDGVDEFGRVRQEGFRRGVEGEREEVDSGGGTTGEEREDLIGLAIESRFLCVSEKVVSERFVNFQALLVRLTSSRLLPGFSVTTRKDCPAKIPSPR